MGENRKVRVMEDATGGKVVYIDEIVFKGKRKIQWMDVEEYLGNYVGQHYIVEETKEIIYIGNEFPEEYAQSESRKALMGASAKAKANASLAIPELIQIASNPQYEENKKESHAKNAKYGWYRYDVQFAIPVFEEEQVLRHNVYSARLLVNHASNGKKYLYDILAIKKETSRPQQ